MSAKRDTYLAANQKVLPTTGSGYLHESYVANVRHALSKLRNKKTIPIQRDIKLNSEGEELVKPISIKEKDLFFKERTNIILLNIDLLFVEQIKELFAKLCGQQLKEIKLKPKLIHSN